MTPLTNDDVIQLGPLHSQSLFQFVHISYAYIFSFNTPTCCNQLDSTLANLGAIVEVE